MLLFAVMAQTAGQWHALIGCYGQHRRHIHSSEPNGKFEIGSFEYETAESKILEKGMTELEFWCFIRDMDTQQRANSAHRVGNAVVAEIFDDVRNDDSRKDRPVARSRIWPTPQASGAL